MIHHTPDDLTLQIGTSRNPFRVFLIYHTGEILANRKRTDRNIDYLRHRAREWCERTGDTYSETMFTPWGSGGDPRNERNP